MARDGDGRDPDRREPRPAPAGRRPAPRHRPPGHHEPGPGRRGPRRPDTAVPTSTLVELTFLPGLEGVLHDEVVEHLAPRRPPRPVAGRDDALLVEVDGPLRPVLELRTAVSASIALHFAVPRPRSLTSGDHLARVVAAVRAAQLAAASSSFRFEAAGKDSAVFARLAQEVAAAIGLPHDPAGGRLVLRVRRGVLGGPAPRGGDADPGWDVLVRIGPRPLSARRWRVVDYPGAANATIAAAMARLAGVVPEDRVVNLMGGSGTLLVERLLAGPAASAVLVDTDPDALAAARENAVAAGLRVLGASDAPRTGVPVELLAADATDHVGLATALAGTAAGGTADLVLADPPWGGLHGSHATAEALHTGLLRAAHGITVPGSRLAVLTHEVRVMERCVAAAALWWEPVGPPLKVFAKGHHPRIWVLRRR
ncbi:RNA methyltransferase [Cellulomonas endophytica]|uniref:RNA methyltransferase n=1 Tax=Cellulomonas endophytica TaxID=2494735 RepID=UPI001F0C75D2|nr:RNA methyltransferase [Cellulomonas endophytica]